MRAWACASAGPRDLLDRRRDDLRPGRRHDHAAGDGQQHRTGREEHEAVQGGQPQPHRPARQDRPAGQPHPRHRHHRLPAICARAVPGLPGCPAGPNNGITARVRPVLAAVRPYNLPSMDATIEVSGLRKRFGPTQALDGMTFTVGPGQVTGFVGPNGAGKSTTMRVILGLDAPDEGFALASGQAVCEPGSPAAARRVAAGRRRAAAEPDRAQPPAVAGPLPGPGGLAGGQGHRAGRPGEDGPAARPAGSRSACGSGWGSPRRCWATRRS